MACTRIAFITLLVCSALVSAGPLLEDYPGADLVDTKQDLDPISRTIILGSLKKINNLLEPERAVVVSGAKESRTLFIPNEKRSDMVRAHYEKQLLRQGEMLFECIGRRCGSSNYWANTVFSAPILYGPEQYQHYLVTRLENGNYLAVYVAMRGTRKVYVHIETTTLPESNKRTRNVFESDQTDELVAMATRSIEEGVGEIRMVVHQGLLQDENVADSVRRAEALGNKIKLQVPGGDRIKVHGLGSLAPSDRYSANRIELILP
jgi:hypothetical protein